MLLRGTWRRMIYICSASLSVSLPVSLCLSSMCIHPPTHTQARAHGRTQKPPWRQITQLLQGLAGASLRAQSGYLQASKHCCCEDCSAHWRPMRRPLISNQQLQCADRLSAGPGDNWLSVINCVAGRWFQTRTARAWHQRQSATSLVEQPRVAERRSPPSGTCSTWPSWLWNNRLSSIVCLYLKMV